MSFFDVFIFAKPPYNSLISPPVATLFSPGVVINSVTVLDEPIVRQTGEDTKIKCTCGFCEDTFKLIPPNVDYKIFKEVLSKWNKINNVIIIKSEVVGLTASAADIDFYLTEFLNISPLPDFFYLAKWLDRGDQFETIKSYSAGGKLIRTRNPHGFSGIGFSTAAFTKLSQTYDPETNPVVCRPFGQVLNSAIQTGTFQAVSTTPPLLFFDTSLTSIRDSSYLKTCELRGDTPPERPLNRRISSDLSLFWVVVVFIVVVIASALTIRFTKK